MIKLTEEQFLWNSAISSNTKKRCSGLLPLDKLFAISGVIVKDKNVLVWGGFFLFLSLPWE